MKFLTKERATLETLLPRLDAQLAEISVVELEQAGSPGLTLFREAGGPGLLIPTEHAGLGATPLEAVRVQRAIGSRSPSLAVATTMHHFSLASLVELSYTSSGFEWMLLEGIARDGRLVASGFAEGRPGEGILKPTMEARPCDGGFAISGSKKPCSLARSMDLLTTSVAVPTPSEDGTQMAVAFVPSTADGIEIRPFWNTWALAGAESDEVTLRDVIVPEDLLIRTETGANGELDELQTSGFLWFELLMTASYLGAASGLVERVLTDEKGQPSDRVALALELESAMGAVEGVCRAMMMGERGGDILSQSLVVRYATQGVIARVVSSAVELLGGMAFISSPEVAQLAAATQALAFHPPSRSRMVEPLLEVFAGEALTVA
jgi:alkylation response protein AidB-like acyl-CoA dehydrogenase